MSDRPASTPASPPTTGTAPAPESVPKLPKTIFNVENKAGTGSSGTGRRSGHK
ncbi:MAG TPA: hypothetical protein VN618_07470 [Solirubrobacteraceae bacterium]|nr:hypothetical protein [Solirubrobacteraceae bacterium]